MADIFLSYAREDAEKVRRVYRALDGLGLSVFWDESIRGGEPWPRELDEKLAQARCVLVFWSTSSAASDWVLAEANRARDTKKLVPVFLELGIEAKLPLPHSDIKGLQLIDWSGSGDHPDWITLVRETVRKIIPEAVWDRIEEHRRQLEADLASERHKRETAEKAAANLDTKLRDEANLRAANESNLAQVQSELARVTDQARELRERVERLETAERGYIASIHEKNQTIGALLGERNKLLADLDSARHELEGLRQAYSLLSIAREQEKSRFLSDVMERDAGLKSAYQAVEELERKLAEKHRDLETLRGSLSSVRVVSGALDDARAQFDTLMGSVPATPVWIRRLALRMVLAGAVLAGVALLGALVGKSWGAQLRTQEAIIKLREETISEQATRIASLEKMNATGPRSGSSTLIESFERCSSQRFKLTTEREFWRKRYLALKVANADDLAPALRQCNADLEAESKAARDLGQEVIHWKTNARALDKEVGRLAQELKSRSPAWTERRLPADPGDPDVDGSAAVRNAVEAKERGDQRQAVAHYLEAVAKGNITAMHNLGVRMILGMGTEKDENQGVIWYRMAAERGFGDSLFQLGQRYNTNGVVLPNRRESNPGLAAWYVFEAIKAGNKQARVEMATSMKNWGMRFCEAFGTLLVQHGYLQKVDTNCVSSKEVVAASQRIK